MDNDPITLEARIVELEIRYTHQEATVQTLSDLVREQHGQIEQLRRALTALRGQMDEDEGGAPGFGGGR